MKNLHKENLIGFKTGVFTCIVGSPRQKKSYFAESFMREVDAFMKIDAETGECKITKK